MADRTVHAFNDLWEVVRYDRAGKWYLEPTEQMRLTPRRAISINQAVEHAMELWANGGSVNFGGPGGSSFDRKVRQKAGRT